MPQLWVADINYHRTYKICPQYFSYYMLFSYLCIHTTRKSSASVLWSQFNMVVDSTVIVSYYRRYVQKLSFLSSLLLKRIPYSYNSSETTALNEQTVHTLHCSDVRWYSVCSSQTEGTNYKLMNVPPQGIRITG